MTPHRLVPVEPTDEMLVAGQEAWVCKRKDREAVEDCAEAAAVYAAMLAASPPAVGSGAVAWRYWCNNPSSALADHWSAWSTDENFRALSEKLGLRAEFAYATPPHAWMDIATAPRDGTPIMLLSPDGVIGIGSMRRREMIGGGEWIDSGAAWVDVCGGPNEYVNTQITLGGLKPESATHWQRLPPAPGEPTAPAPASPLVRGLLELAAKWDEQARQHGVRTFTGNDHAIFANELRVAIGVGSTT